MRTPTAILALSIGSLLAMVLAVTVDTKPLVTTVAYPGKAVVHFVRSCTCASGCNAIVETATSPDGPWTFAGAASGNAIIIVHKPIESGDTMRFWRINPLIEGGSVTQ